MTLYCSRLSISSGWLITMSDMKEDYRCQDVKCTGQGRYIREHKKTDRTEASGDKKKGEEMKQRKR